MPRQQRHRRRNLRRNIGVVEVRPLFGAHDAQLLYQLVDQFLRARLIQPAVTQIALNAATLTELGGAFRALQAAGAAFEVGESSFEDQGRSRVMLKNQGALRVYGSGAKAKFDWRRV